MPSSTQKAKKGMDHHDILAAIKRQKSSYVKIANALDIKPVSVRNVAIGNLTSHRVATYIAELIKTPIDDIWPDTYHYTPRESFKQRCDNTRSVA